MKKIILFSCILLISSLVINSCSFTQKYEGLQSDVQVIIDSLIANTEVPGVTVGISLADNSIAVAAGFADVEDKTLMTTESVMMAGSVGKTWVSASIMKLYQEGKIDLNDKAADYLLEDNLWLNKVSNFEDVTIHMLLTHTTGIGRWVFKMNVWKDLMEYPDKIWTNEDRLGYIFDDPALFPAGSAFAYSDVNYLILGMIIEKQTGLDYYDYIKKEFIEKYKLKYTVPSDKRNIEGLVAGYTGMSEAFSLPEKMLKDGLFAFNPQMEWTGGGVATTTTDLAIWAKLLWGGTVLSHETTELMLSPVEFRTFLPERAKYGCGVFVGETNGTSYFGHTGFMPGYGTIVQYIPDYDFSLAIQFNSDAAPDPRSQVLFTNQIKDVIINALSVQEK